MVEVRHQSNEKEITIQATREGDPETRTVRNADGSVWWTPGDAISLFYGSGTDGGSKFTSNATENSQVTHFSGTITAITGGGEYTDDDIQFWGVYPYGEDVSCDGSAVTLTLPSQQEAVPGTFASNLFPSMGRSLGLKMAFYNICGGWRFSITKEGVRKVTLKSNGGEPIAGKVKVGFNDAGVPEIREIIDGSDEVVLEAPAGQYFEPGSSYYMVLLPTVFESGFTMTFETSNEEGVYNRTAKTTITRSKFYGITNIDNYLTTPYAPKTGNIPIEDATFKAYLVEHFDSDENGEISYEEAESITEISLSPTNEYNLQSLQGIEYMPNLEVIDCPGDWYDTDNKANGIDREHYYVGPYSDNWEYAWGPIGTLRYVDESNNPHLQVLNLYNNSALGEEVVRLSLDNNPDLEELRIGMTWMEYPDLSNNPELKMIDFTHLRGTVPDFSGLNNVKELVMDYPQDGSGYIDLDVSGMKDLEILHVDARVRSLSDLSNNPKLKGLNLNHCNALSGTLDLSGNPALEELECEYTYRTSLDVSSNPSLKRLRCLNNQISELSLTNNNCLEYLECSGNHLTTLDVTSIETLREIYCDGNPLTSLDVSYNHNLEVLGFSGTQINAIDLSNNLELRVIGCDNIHGLTSLDLTNNPRLNHLWVRNDGLTSLDLSNNPSLSVLACHGNRISTLDVSNNLHIDEMYCSPMEDADGNNLLSILYISENQVIPYVTENRDEGHIPASTEIRIASNGGGGDDPDDPDSVTYSIGDIIDSDGLGIVFWVSDDGKSALLVSVTELRNQNWQTSNNWCISYGDSWRMPVIEELTQIHLNFETINSSLSSNGFTLLSTENICYWSSTANPNDGSYFYRERLHDGTFFTNLGNDEKDTSKKNYTRAVKEIGTGIPSSEDIPTISSRYSIGDIIESDGLGIIVYYDVDRRVAELMSVSELKNVGWSDADDWCSNYGNNWGLPNKDVLDQIAVGFYLINKALKENNYTQLAENEYYWSNSQVWSNSDLQWGHGAAILMPYSGTTYANGRFNARAVKVLYDYDLSVETKDAIPNQIYNYTGDSNQYCAALQGYINNEIADESVWTADEKYFYYSETANTIETLKFTGTKVTANNAFKANLSDLKENTKYYYVACIHIKNEYGDGTTVIADDVKSFTTPKYYLPPYVDLGLPSGVKWGTMILGASNPLERGASYCWGHSGYHGNSDYQPGDILPLEEDPANIALGGYWRTPTKQEWDELLTYCNCSYSVSDPNKVMHVSKGSVEIVIPLTSYWTSTCYSACWTSSNGGWQAAQAYYLTGSSDRFQTYIEEKRVSSVISIEEEMRIRAVYVDR